MRLHEFATPDEQLQLWRMVSDAVWSAIDSQRQQTPKRAVATSPPIVRKTKPIKVKPPTKLKKVAVPPKPKPKMPAALPLAKNAIAQSQLPTTPLTPNQRWAQRQKKLTPAPLTKSIGTKIPQNQSNTWEIG
jgi:hypothetical protein